MDSIISSVTSALLSKALDVSSSNHKIIANNIANESTVGFAPASLDFDAVMSQVKSMVENGASEEELKSAIDQITPEALPTVQEAGAKVMLDKEMVSLMDNSVRYQALIMARKGLGGIMKSAINGGKG